MPLPLINITPNIEQQAGNTKPVKLVFKAVRVFGADGETLPTQDFIFNVQTNGTVTETASAYVQLPAPTTGSFQYNFEIWISGKAEGFGRFLLNDDTSPINLSALIAAGGTLTPSTQQYVDEQIAGVSAGATDWGDIGGTLADQTDLQTALDTKQTAAQVNALIAAASIGAAQITGTKTSSFISDFNTAVDARITAANLQAALVSGTNIKTVNGNSLLGSGDLTISGGGGLEIGAEVVGGSTGSVLFVGAGGLLDEDNDNFFWNAADNQLKITSAANGGGLLLQGAEGGYFVDVLQFKTQGYNQTATFNIGEGDGGGVRLSLKLGAHIGDNFAVCDIVGNTLIKFYGGGLYGTAVQRVLFDAYTPGTIGATIKAAASQTADLLQLQNSSGTSIAAFDKRGALKLASIADADAPNSSLYYSTDAAKPVWKSSGGTVNALY